MTIQLFVPEGADLKSTVVLGENDVRVLPVGSDEFFSYWESLKGRKRARTGWDWSCSAWALWSGCASMYAMPPHR